MLQRGIWMQVQGEQRVPIGCPANKDAAGSAAASHRTDGADSTKKRVFKDTLPKKPALLDPKRHADAKPM